MTIATFVRDSWIKQNFVTVTDVSLHLEPMWIDSPRCVCMMSVGRTLEAVVHLC